MRALRKIVEAFLLLFFRQISASNYDLRGRAKLHAEGSNGLSMRYSASEVQRTNLLKTLPPFDIEEAASFVNFMGAIRTDALLLFFSPTCPDCEKLMPLWARTAGIFEKDNDLTVISVSDDAGRAPAPYTHTENPAIFFIPKGDASHPVPFPMSFLHEFVALPETAATDREIVNRLVAFTRGHATDKNKISTVPPSPSLTGRVPAVAARSHDVLSDAQSATLTARMLATLKAKEGEPIQEQLKIVLEPQYQGLAVVDFLRGVAGGLHQPLAQVAATYLDGLPTATKWAREYARSQEESLRSRGWAPTVAEEQSYFQDLVAYALPQYAKNIYFQRGIPK